MARFQAILSYIITNYLCTVLIYIHKQYTIENKFCMTSQHTGLSISTYTSHAPLPHNLTFRPYMLMYIEGYRQLYFLWQLCYEYAILKNIQKVAVRFVEMYVQIKGCQIIVGRIAGNLFLICNFILSVHAIQQVCAQSSVSYRFQQMRSEVYFWK